MKLDYKKLTVFNFQVTYYVMRFFTFFWLLQQYQIFTRNAERPLIFYSPITDFQKLLQPEFPSKLYFLALCFILAINLIWSILKPNYICNILIFLTIALINLPIGGYLGLGHHNHVFILFYLLTIFLLPNKLVSNDYKLVQYMNFGLLVTYSVAGLWKVLSMVRDSVTQNPEISWLEPNAAKMNSLVNYYMIDSPIPNWMEILYQNSTLWILITVFGILMQTFCFLGAYSRKYLTLTMLFLFTFHMYTNYFVLADWKIMKYGIVLLFFPYHYFYSFIKKRFPNFGV